MSASPSGCLDATAVTDYVHGLLDAERVEAVRAHLHACEVCRRVVADVVEGASSTGQERADEEGAPAFGRLGRYLLLERLGAGGMGVVYAAYDPKLDRKIAIKLLRAAAHREGGAARAELLLEARNMARLSHPNVVAVHDAGEIGEEVFVAMDLVEGQTLAQWLSSAEPTLAELLAKFIGAGHGLAAAHRAGIVHRDVKASNVLVARDGRALMADFGLASRVVAPTGPSPFAGTLAYTAPEQLTGAGADARSDQFSFCVMLWEAVAKRRPFVADTVDGLLAQVKAGASPKAWPGPRWLLEVLTRGLQAEPAARFPSMEALLAKLARDRSRARPLRWAAAAVLVLLVGGGTAAFLDLGASRCRDAARPVQETWGPSQREALQASFAQSKAPYARDTQQEVTRTLEQYVEAWSHARIEACEATWVGRTQSEEVLGLRTVCLERRRQELGALIEVLSTADGKTMEGAAQAVHSLVPIDACGAVPSARVASRDPVDSNRSTITAALARAKALLDSGKFDDALAEAGRARAIAEQGASKALLAEALVLEGELHGRLGQYTDGERLLHQASVAAEASGHDVVLVRAYTLLIDQVGTQQARFAEGHRYAEHAMAIIARLGGDPTLEADVASLSGNLSYGEAHFSEALAQHERVLALRRSLFGAKSLPVALSLTFAGNAELAMGQADQALARFEQALAIREALLGPEHPAVAYTRTNLGAVYLKQGQLERAIAESSRAREALERALGPELPALAFPLENLGEAYAKQGKWQPALAAFERAIVLLERANGPENPLLVYDLVARAECSLALGDASGGREALTRAVRLAALEGAAPDDAGRARLALAKVLVREDREAAVRLAQSAAQSFGVAGKDSEAALAEAKAWLAANVPKGPSPPAARR